MWQYLQDVTQLKKKKLSGRRPFFLIKGRANLHWHVFTVGYKMLEMYTVNTFIEKMELFYEYSDYSKIYDIIFHICLLSVREINVI